MHSGSSYAALCLQRCCCLPTIKRTATWLLSPAKMTDWLCLFAQPPAHGASWHTHAVVHARRAAGQIKFGEQSKAASGVEPRTLITLVPRCPLSSQPVLPNAYLCLVAFCKPADIRRFTCPLHLLARLFVYCPVCLELPMKPDKKEALDILYLK